ncbi:hypothetical protein EHO60_14440 [Leptospira fletcheri]|uniref:Uncharacterized protein n=1 Tax=Leptospira fletcheri TaxID=2484981 RepID=A0A4R9GAM3_9LEPT|nr:hypothetical protein [Leptospira fletcheri]TGK08772.1 hypothetical protein EHO60_14440 [Leptospira fletcheri]
MTNVSFKKIEWMNAFLLCICLLLIHFSTLRAEENTDFEIPPMPDSAFPKLARTGKSSKDFVPKGWIIECEQTGDISKDTIPDLVLLLHQNDSKKIIANRNGIGVDTMNSNPRILVVALGLPNQGGFRLAVENHSFIPRYTVPTMNDPLSSCPVITKGTLYINLGYWANAGTWNTWDYTYIFWYQSSALRLIGYDYNSTWRNTGELNSKSANYLTCKVKKSNSRIDSDKKNETWSKLSDCTLKTIDDISDGLNFDRSYQE